MPADGDDPALLFTPPRRRSTAPSSVLSEVPATSTEGGRDSDAPDLRVDSGDDDAPFCVQVPRMTTKEKEKYVDGQFSDSDDDSEAGIVELVGEYHLGSMVFIYALHKDTIYRRKEEWQYKMSHPKLYDEYLRKKQRGTLPQFDPSGPRVHHRDRVGLSVTIEKAKLKDKKNAKSRQRSVEDDSQFRSDNSDLPDEASDDDADDDDYGSKHSPRRSMPRRAKEKPGRDLPFSPKKTRARTGMRAAQVIIIDSDLEGEAEDESAFDRTRLRSKQKKKYNEDEDEADYDYRSEEEEDRPRKAKRAIKKTGPRPAYGRIRDVENLYDSDPETAALRAHREVCEKCHREPAHVLLRRLAKRKGRKKKVDDEFEEDEQEAANALGGWVRCLKCCVAAHWGCLARNQQADILKAARAKAMENDEDSPRRIQLEAQETTEFVCGSCAKGGICMVCRETAVAAEVKPAPPTSAPRAPSDTEAAGAAQDSTLDAVAMLHDSTVAEKLGEPNSELLYRCFTCKRLAHYGHMSVKGEELDIVDVAEYFQKSTSWQCEDCASYSYPVDQILAWRPYPLDAVEAPRDPSEPVNHKQNLPREYLVKWAERSYRRTQWVPHMWLLAAHAARLKNFLATGSKVQLLKKPVEDNEATGAHEEKLAAAEDLPLFAVDEDASRDTSAGPDDMEGSPIAMPDAEQRIPVRWKTVERVLDVLLWSPLKGSQQTKRTKGKAKKADAGSDDSSMEQFGSENHADFEAVFETGEQPAAEYTETVEEFESRKGRLLQLCDIDRVIWALIKWDDMSYDEATWDSPPQQGTQGYAEFQHAFKSYISSRDVDVKKKNKAEVEALENRLGQKSWKSDYLGVPEDGSYDIGQDRNLTLFDFQVEGVNWLCKNWFHHQHCILADDMGLGKTVQIITFLGLLHKTIGLSPSLIVVPNSTITNWVREFGRWAPNLRVVPFYGEAKAREMIKKYELFHNVVKPGTTGAKYHVLVTTYDTATNSRDFTAVFRNTPRWEVLIVDEGQRLKNDSSVLFKRLNELNSCHRVIMTGTPLNNNIRELFNLMNFLSPDEWSDLESLEQHFSELDDDRVKELHERLRPYFLRRIKSEVLKLPPKNEVIVPLSMAALQKEVYKSILSKNFEILRSLTEASSSRSTATKKKSGLRNILMQLRKCVQHPYLIADDIEPKGLSRGEAHSKLIDGSGKLRLLKILLPKLKARGHRVLLFSQFVIGLNIVEDFLAGEGYKFLRLDGDTKQDVRQRRMDEFNRDGSDVFIFMLSTRAGGVGINLFTADTVIIFDPDFNPHNDLQAIARSYRFGQKKTCLVFKFMTKNSVEEKIMQTAKKKLVLDHLIVQKMDDDENTEDVESMLTFGAKALFENEGDDPRDIKYNEADVDKLIEKTETEGDDKEQAEAANNAFSFAKVWSATKDSLDDLAEEEMNAGGSQMDSWAQTLATIATQIPKADSQEIVGRGARRKAAQVKVNYYVDGSPEKAVDKGKGRGDSHGSETSDDEFAPPNLNSPSDSESGDAPGASLGDDDMRAKPRNEIPMDLDHAEVNVVSQGRFAISTGSSALPSFDRTLSPIHNQARMHDDFCGLCKKVHKPGDCYMVQKPENLAEYRKLLFTSEDEPFDLRMQAVRAIDETLSKRGALHLIRGQPLAGDSFGGHKHKAPSHHSKKSKAGNLPGTGKWVMNGASSSKPKVAGSSVLPITGPSPSLKRPGSPVAAISQIKRAKPSSCAICKHYPYHSPRDCPQVAQGRMSVRKAIARLTDEGGHSETLSALRGILKKLRQEEATAPPT